MEQALELLRLAHFAAFNASYAARSKRVGFYESLRPGKTAAVPFHGMGNS